VEKLKVLSSYTTPENLNGKGYFGSVYVSGRLDEIVNVDVDWIYLA
jgi:hypothetical protein